MALKPGSRVGGIGSTRAETFRDLFPSFFPFFISFLGGLTVAVDLMLPRPFPLLVASHFAAHSKENGKTAHEELQVRTIGNKSGEWSLDTFDWEQDISSCWLFFKAIIVHSLGQLNKLPS